MSTIESFVKELDQEAVISRKMLERVPAGHFDWKPHPKSMSIRQLSTHIAELPSWISLAFHTDGIDFEANAYEPTPINSVEELMSTYEKSYKEARENLLKADEEDLLPSWTMRAGDHIIDVNTKGGVIRVALSQQIHHRAQLGVFLRLLDIPIPGSYGPSADEPWK